MGHKAVKYALLIFATKIHFLILTEFHDPPGDRMLSLGAVLGHLCFCDDEMTRHYTTSSVVRVRFASFGKRGNDIRHRGCKFRYKSLVGV